MHQTKNRKNEDSSLDDAFIECTAQRQPIHPPGNMAKASSNVSATIFASLIEMNRILNKMYFYRSNIRVTIHL